VAGFHNIVTQRGHQPIFKACVNINANQPIVCKDKTKVIVSTVLHRSLRLLKVPQVSGAVEDAALRSKLSWGLWNYPRRTPLFQIFNSVGILE
jgi:hypothetical protein